MPELSFPFLTAAIAIPAVAALFARNPRICRVAAAIGAGASAILSGIVLWQVTQAHGAKLSEPVALLPLAADALGAVPMLLYSLLVLGVAVMAPKRDETPETMSGSLVLLSSTLAAYAADHPLFFCFAWVVSTLPFLVHGLISPGNWRPRVALGASNVALVGGCLLLPGHSMAGFALLLLAITLRKGIFPAHAWVEEAVDNGNYLATMLLMNAHLGAFALARLVIPAFPDATQGAFPLLSDLALFTAVYVALRALSERRTRRIIALLTLSQSACILAGLESGSAEGITGGLVHWLVVAVATTALSGVLRMMEVRFSMELTTDRHMGLATVTPRLAVFFAVAGLALVGLPGTLGFCAEDLLIHGTLASHPQLGVLLPLATAMNAFTLFRLFSRLFLGGSPTRFHGIADALPRERMVLTLAVLFLVLGGVVPSFLVSGRSDAAHHLEAGPSARAIAPHR